MEPKYPLLTDRIQSSFIDLGLLIALMFAITRVFENMEPLPEAVRVGVFLALFVGYEPICTTFGSTLGNYVKKIRVRRSNDPTKRINFFQALLRFAVKLSLGWLSFLTVNGHPKKRAIHDLACGSVVVRV